MNISLNWLNDYIDIGNDADWIAETLSDLGFPVEGIERLDHDTVLDVEVTSNRGDCLGHIGVARELSVATGKPLKLPEIHFPESEVEAQSKVSVEIEAPEWCARYTARVIEEVKVGPTPDWMRQRLEAVGLRSVSNVVDATNYALMECGQPPHAFDMDKLQGGKIIVRRGKQGEKLVSIDETKCELNEETLVIADVQEPVAIAGVMGGLATEVSDQTTNILLEDAHFDPVCVRTTSRRLVLPSDAAYRFERIVDRENIDWASRRTAQLIVEVAGGTVLKGVVDAYPGRQEPETVTLRLSRLKHLLGIDVPVDDVMRILSALGMNPRQEDQTVVCTSPTWRSDISREVDLIEEVARCYGYDKVPTRSHIEIEVVPPDERQRHINRVQAALNACGYYETINVDFVDQKTADLFAVVEGQAHLGVKDSSRKGTNLLRQSLLGSLMGVLKTNVNAKNTPCRVFEVSHSFVPGKEGLPTEHTQMALVSDGTLTQLRSAVEQGVRALQRSATIEFVPVECKWAVAAAQVLVDGQAVGIAGVVSDSVCQQMEIKHVTPVAAELDFDFLTQNASDVVTLQPLAKFPAIERDLSILVKETVLWADIVAAIKAAAPAELEEICFVEVYQGKGIAAGTKSVTLSLRFRDQDGTLQHEAVDGFQNAIVTALKDAVQAELRG